MSTDNVTQFFPNDAECLLLLQYVTVYNTILHFKPFLQHLETRCNQKNTNTLQYPSPVKPGSLEDILV